MIIISYADYDEAELDDYEPAIVHVDTRQPARRRGHRQGARRPRPPAPRRYVEVPARV